MNCDCSSVLYHFNHLQPPLHSTNGDVLILICGDTDVLILMKLICAAAHAHAPDVAFNLCKISLKLLTYNLNQTHLFCCLANTAVSF